MKLNPGDIGRTVAYKCKRGEGTGRIESVRFTKRPGGQSAFMADLTGPLAEGGAWTWIHEDCLAPTTELDR